MKKQFGGGAVCVFLVLLLVVAGTSLAQEKVKLNGYEIDVKGQEPAVPKDLEAANDVQHEIRSIPTASIIQLYKDKNQFRQGQKPAVPKDLKLQGDRKYKKWIVQFTGPIQEGQKKALADLGCRIGDYLPDFAFIVTMDNNTKKQVEKLPFINGVVRHKPAYKIQKRLKDESGSVRAEKGKKVKLNIRVDDPQNRDLVLSEIHKKKGKVLGVSGDVVRVEVDQEHINQLSQIEEVLWIEESVPLKLLNNTTTWTIQTYVPDNRKIWDKGIHGEGQIVGIGDSGLDYDMPWFRDPSGAPIGPTHRKVVGYTVIGDDYDGNMGHGTHVSGTVGGDQTPVTGQSTANGMAPKSKLYMQDLTPGEQNYIYPPADLGDLFITPYYAGARLHTNSWGAVYNEYESLTRSVDHFMWEHKDFLVLFANGNAGPYVGSVGFPATAKNIVSVGATENATGLGAETLAWWSSNGPADDGRIKPTVTAPGVDIISADSDGIKNSFNSGTIAFSGTSMATPAVAGAAALVRQYYVDGYWPSGTANPGNSLAPSAALVKATLINSAQDMTGAYIDAPIPSTGQGWGRINLSNALYFAGDTKFLDVADVDTGLVTGAMWSKNFFASGGQQLKVTLVWTDYPGTLGAAKALVNDLDLTVTAPDGATTYRGNVFQNGMSVIGGSEDRLNVEEQVLISTVQPGSYTVTVTGHNIPNGPQPFAIVVTGATGVNSRGFISLDKTRYNGSNTIRIIVGDRDLNLNSAVAEEVSVTIKSATEPAGEAVRLIETGADTSIFIGTIPTRLGPAAPGNGSLEVAEGDAITATYSDANDGTGGPATVTATALTDLTPPIISAVAAGAIGQDNAFVSFTTNKLTAATVNYGETAALGASQSAPWLTDHHGISLANLKEVTTYYYEVSTTDEAGNVSRDDNNGAKYSFTTLSLPPNLTLNSSNGSVTYELDTVIFGQATDPSGVASVMVNGQPASYRSSDGYYELTVPLAVGENSFTVAATDTRGNVTTLSTTLSRLEPSDLVMTQVVGPSGGGYGAYIHIENTVCNIGRGKSYYFLIGWYLSTDTVISPADDIAFSGYALFPPDYPLLPGECFSFPADLQIPGNAVIGNTYYLGAYADCFENELESDETNNGLAGNQITIEGPDLALTSLSAPSSALTATPFTVSTTVTNVGLGFSFNSNVGIYLSTDSVITRSDLLIGHKEWLGFYPGQPRTDNTVVTIPSTVPGGTYYIGAIVDPFNLVAESNETNNTLPGNQIIVTGPDIVMTAVSGPSSGQTGATIAISNTVTASASGGAASGVSVYFYLSTDNVITPSDTLLGDRFVSGLAPGASNTADTVVTIPATFAGGTYYIGAIADPGNSVYESNETNNVAVGNQITITGPDLIMTSVSGPSSGVTGGTITVSNTVAASGTGSAAPGFYVGVFLSTDNVITPSDTLLGYRFVSGLAPGASSAADIPVTIPASLAPGTYYIGAIADNFAVWIGDEGGYQVYDNAKEPDETNNALAGNQITITGSDLTMSAVSGPTSALAGQTITVSSTAAAGSNGGGAGGFSIGFYLSHDSVITTSDTYLSNRYVYGLGPGASSTADTTVTIPAGLAPGTYYIGAIADSTNQVIESNESNNALAGNQIAVIGPDLFMSSVSGPTSAHGGDTITVNNTVAASADGSSVTRSFRVILFLSADAVITTSDIVIGERTVNSLASGASSAANTAVTISSTLTPGTYYIGAIVDPYNQVHESNEANNSLSGDQIVVTGPDLTMSALSYPTTGVINGTITVSDTVTNSSASASPGFSVGLYLSTDNVIAGTDIFLGSRSVSGLAAGASSSADTTVTIPSSLGEDEYGVPIYLAPGTYYIGAIADISHSVGESNETNNTRAGTQIVITSP